MVGGSIRERHIKYSRINLIRANMLFASVNVGCDSARVGAGPWHTNSILVPGLAIPRHPRFLYWPYHPVFSFWHHGEFGNPCSATVLLWSGPRHKTGRCEARMRVCHHNPRSRCGTKKFIQSANRIWILRFFGWGWTTVLQQDPPCKSVSTQIHESVMPFMNTSLRAFLFRTRHGYSGSWISYAIREYLSLHELHGVVMNRPLLVPDPGMNTQLHESAMPFMNTRALLVSTKTWILRFMNRLCLS